MKLQIEVHLYEMSEIHKMHKNENCDNYRCCNRINGNEIKGTVSTLQTYTVGTLEYEYKSAQSRRKMSSLKLKPVKFKAEMKEASRIRTTTTIGMEKRLLTGIDQNVR